MAPAPIAKVSRPAARYRPGKAAGGAGGGASDSEASGSDDEQRSIARPIDDFKQQQPLQRQQAGIVIQSGSAPIDLSRVSIGGKQVPKVEASESEYETDSEQEDEPAPALKPVFRSAAARAAEVKKEEEAQSSEYETDSESEEEEKPKPMLKPMFVPKRARQTIPVAPTTKEGEAGEDELTPAERKAAVEAEERRKESRAAAAERIRRDMDEKKAQDDVPDLDDTDDVDPEAEFAAWRIRELERLKRDRDALRVKEEEREEIERRRALPQEQRDREDTERAEQSRREKKKGAQGFMQKYYHKGAFFQDMDILKKYDFTEATEGDVNKAALPSVLQVRDYGKKSRSKYTHLANEDTTRAGDDPRFKKANTASGASAFTNQAATTAASGSTMGGAGQGCFACGGPHLKRDCPQLGAGAAGGAPSVRTATGANGAPSSSTRQWGARPSGEKRQRSQSPPRYEREGKAARFDREAPPGAAERARGERSWRSRSRSPPRRDPREREREEREREREYERKLEKERRRDWERERDRDWRK